MTKDRTSNDARADSGGASAQGLKGRRVGSSYILRRPIGQGATGTVWQGRDEATGDPVAIKLLHESLLRQPKLVTRFVQERTILLMLRHRNVVRVRDLFSVGETLGLVMDLVDGGSLRDHLRRHRTMPPAEAARLAAQIASALAEAHELGVVHRDLKPDNVLLQTENGRLETRLTDFGVARILNTPSMTTPNAVVGTPHYMAPEAFHSSTPSPATDVYALGVLVYELVCGRPPYDSDAIPELMRHHMDGGPERRPGIPDALWAVIASCMEVKPRLRPAAAELVLEFSEAAELAGNAPALAAPPGAAVDPSRFDEPVGKVERPSVVPEPRAPMRPRNRVPNRRWAHPGATMSLIAGAMAATAIAAAVWNVGRAGGGTRDESASQPSPPAASVASPAPAVSRRVTARAPISAAPRKHPGVTPVTSTSAASVRREHPAAAATHATTRSPRTEAQPYGPWQCSQTFAFDFATRIPLSPRPCQTTGRDIRYQASLTAPGGATGSISISLLDTASGRTVAGPKTCNGLSFTGNASTETCGPAPASPVRGRNYAIVMSYRYERQGQTVSSTAKGGTFGF